jgi:F0F1-type ATP synthase assembly protein I
MTEEGKSDKDQTQYVKNLTVAGVLGQVGCLTLVVIFGALIGGLWLDNVLETKPLFTLILMIGSIPVTLVMMFWIVRRGTAMIQNVPNEASDNQEDVSSGE